PPPEWKSQFEPPDPDAWAPPRVQREPALESWQPQSRPVEPETWTMPFVHREPEPPLHWEPPPAAPASSAYASAPWTSQAAVTPHDDWHAHGDLDLPVPNESAPREPAAPRAPMYSDRTLLTAAGAVVALLLVLLVLQFLPAAPRRDQAQRSAP